MTLSVIVLHAKEPAENLLKGEPVPATKALYCVMGYVPGLEELQHIKTRAYSKAQAKRQVAKQLETRLKRSVYLGNMDVLEYDTHNHPQKNN